jgi:hypothetical protein
LEKAPEQKMDGCTCAGLILDLIITVILISFPATSEPWITLRFIGVFIIAPALLVVLYVQNKMRTRTQD